MIQTKYKVDISEPTQLVGEGVGSDTVGSSDNRKEVDAVDSGDSSEQVPLLVDTEKRG